MLTLSRLLTQLADEYDTGRRPARYFDVPKRGELSRSEVSYVKQRFRELVEREACVDTDPDDPSCYEKVKTDIKPRSRKRKSSYLKDYEAIYRSGQDITETPEYRMLRRRYPKIPVGIAKISAETGLPILRLKEVYDIGVGAYASSGSRTGMSAQQWGYGRIYAFIMSYFHNEDGRYTNQRFFQNFTDFHILEKILDEL